MNEYEKFGKRLEAAITAKGKTRREVAALTHSTGTTIGKWIRGGAPYCVLVLAELHCVLDIDLNELICGKGKGKGDKNGTCKQPKGDEDGTCKGTDH